MPSAGMTDLEGRECHTTVPIVETHGSKIVILCGERHLIAVMSRKEWAGSWAEANASVPVTCFGTLERKGV